MDWLVANWKDLLLAFTSLVTAASIISKFTKNVWDDKIFAAILRFIAFIPTKAK